MSTQTATTPDLEVTASNESRFNAANLSEPLTAFAVGWADPAGLGDLLDFIAPPVPVGRRFEFRKADNAEAFLSETDDLRAIGSEFKRIEYTGTSVNEKTLNKGLTVRVDHDEGIGDDWPERYTQMLLQRLLRNEIRRAITALDAAATSASKTWDDTANPDGDVREALSLGADAAGVRPNRVLFGESAWDLRSSSYYSQSNAGAFYAAGLTPEEAARKYFVDGVRVVSARYQNGATKAAVLGDAVYAYNTSEGAMKDEPSNIKRFITPADGGPFRVYLDEHAKYTDISVEHYSNVVVTSTLGIRKLAVSAT